MARILIVEDHRDVNALLAEALGADGHDVVSVFDGLQARRAAADGGWDLVLLDLMLPYVDGSTILAEIRATSGVPVLVLSAKDAVWSKIDLLRLGADDYVTKPFDLGELSARVDSLLRRSTRAVQVRPVLTYRDLALDTGAARVTVAGRDVALTATEYRILELLMASPDRVLSKAAIYEGVWDEQYLGDDSAVKTHLSNLRSKLKLADPDGTYIETVWGIGYRMPRVHDRPAA
jgi:DNA-binding response OmpR family regulator